MQDGIQQVEKWGIRWGFKFYFEKTKVMFIQGGRSMKALI